MLEEMNLKVKTPVIVNIDNQSAMKIAENDVDHSRTKHIDIKNHFIKNEINDMVELKWVATENQIAHIFTKGLGYPTYNKLKNMLVSKVQNQMREHHVVQKYYLKEEKRKTKN